MAVQLRTDDLRTMRNVASVWLSETLVLNSKSHSTASSGGAQPLIPLTGRQLAPSTRVVVSLTHPPPPAAALLGLLGDV